jgi:Fe-S-cluster containining protein
MSDRPDEHDEDLLKLERQVERGSFFTHTMVSQFADRLNEVEPILYGLIDSLIKRGLVTQEELLAASSATRDELVEREETFNPQLALRVDDAPSDAPTVPVDCAARMPICRSVCCKLSFALTVEEIEAGVVRWDLGQPYFIRHEADGHCTHRDRSSGGCTVYEQRPMVCKRYSCANDTRIWKDFQKMELNREWLDANLDDDGPHMVEALMHPPQDLLRKIRRTETP